MDKPSAFEHIIRARHFLECSQVRPEAFATSMTVFNKGVMLYNAKQPELAISWLEEARDATRIVPQSHRTQSVKLMDKAETPDGSKQGTFALLAIFRT